MPKEVLDEREFELVNIIGADLGANQRDLSRLMSLSLGMVNMLVRRLLSKGIIRIEQLDKRKVQYLLTPKGFSEKMRKSVQYTLKTINSLDLIKEKIHELIVAQYREGERDFIVLGRSDFAHLIEIVFKDLGLDNYKINYIDSLSDDSISGLLIICKEKFDINKKKVPNSINLIHELANDQRFINNTGVANEFEVA